MIVVPFVSTVFWPVLDKLLAFDKKDCYLLEVEPCSSAYSVELKYYEQTG
jgi:hypothetical protein